MAWLVQTYLPVSFFSLRPANATASGGRSLITPTAFSIKMALLSVSIQQAGLDAGKARFAAIRDLQIALALPEHIVLVKSFAKVRRPAEFKDAAKRDEKIAELSEKGQYPFQSTIAYRELVQFSGSIAVAVTMPNGGMLDWLGSALLGINYLGKRGSFLQPASQSSVTDTLPESYTTITRDSADGGSIAFNGTLQVLDDCGTSMTFDHANIYNSKRITLGKERVLRHVVLPYRLAQSSRGYSRYQRL
jgi:hypothetical protein